MAEIVISIVAKVAELLVVPVGKHICYTFKYKSNMAELKEQVANLTDARVRVQHSIEEAERQGHGIEDDVKNWMKSVDEFTEGVAKNIIGGDEDKENKAKKLCSIGFCPNLMARYSFSKKAAKTAKKGVNLLEKGKFQKVWYCPAIQRTGSIYIRGYNDFDSRTPIFQELMQTLEDDNVNIIGVHGMGGVGKTTLVKRVVGKAIDDNLFDVVVMADVTQTPDIQKIQAQIADVLSLTFNRESLDGRAAKLRDRLKKEKRILLVLDDLWKKLDLQDVGIPFWEGGNAEQRQCKLLLTSRDLYVLRDHMNTQKNFQLKVLTDEEAGNLFWQTVGDSTNRSDFDTIGVEIIRHCAGLPVAIATIASALKNKSPSNWKDALDQLKMSNPRHIEGMEAEVYSAIKLSYDFLQSEEAKSVFLLCSLYDASFNIDIDYLLQYCIGLGVFQGVSTIEQARNRLHKIIDKLKASHLLLGGNTNMFVKMHDIVHAVAFSIASTDKLMFNIQDVTDLKETLVEKLPKNSTAMSLPFKDVSDLPERLECSELKLLVLLMKGTSSQLRSTFFEGMERLSLRIPDTFFERTEGLKVLHLNNIHMLSLPSSLCRLTSLQTLRLNRCWLGDIAVIGALKRIEILSFDSSSIEQLPRDLSQLTRLRLLDLRYCSNLKVISPNLISSLTRLEELYIGNSFVKWDVEGRRNASLAELKQLPHLKLLDIRVLDSRIIPQDLLIFEKLESYIICIGDVWNLLDHSEYQWMQKFKLNNLDNYFESSRMLKLKLNDSNIYLGNDFRLLLNRAEDICLDKLKGVKNVVCQLDGEGFQQLKHLYVRNNPEIEYIISAIGRDLCNVFPKLESLFLDRLVNLKKIRHGQLAPESFNKLRIMKVQKCDTLNYLFSFSMVKNLSQLQEIEVTDCKKLEVIIFKESEEQVHQNDRINRVEFTQLHTLRLEDLPRLTSFVFHSLTPNTESQEIVSEDQPRGFKSLFSQNVAFLCLKELNLHRLPKLLHLWIVFENLTNLNVSYCENLKTLVPSSMPLEKLTTLTVALPCLKRLLLRKLPGLLHLWKENSQPSKVFENLSHLKVAGCGNLTTLLPSSVSLQNLMNLDVQECDGLINLVPFSTAQSLKQLEKMIINGCKMIEEIVIDMGDEVKDKIVFDKLITLEFHCLPSLTSFCKGDFTIEFPSLRQVFVMKCLKMMSFSRGVLSTPKLQRLELKEVDCGDDDYDWFWERDDDDDDNDELILESEEGDLNTSIQQFFEDRKKMAEEIQFFKLKTGAEIPSVGLGTWYAAPGIIGDAVSTAVKVGYRHIDCAPLHGNEKEIGCALKKLLDDGVVKREDLWITSKLWCTDHLPEDVPRALDRTLQDLQLDYLDLYLIHWPVSMKKGSDMKNPKNLTQPDIPGTWRAMEALYDSGKARAIGVSNFSIKKLGDLLDIARVPPAVNQVECHPSWKQTKLHAFCKSKEVHLSGYSSLGSPSDKHDIEVLEDPILNMVAQKLGKSPEQVALRWGLQMGHSVLTKSTKEARLKKNYDVFGWYIPEYLLAKLSEIVQERLFKGTFFVHENFGAYKTLEELWDGEI